jgi:hypothetical protein
MRRRIASTGTMRTSDDSSALGRLLKDAAGPALPDELAGEQAARSMFSEARLSATTDKETRVFSKALITKTLAVKLGAAAVGLSFVGVATAAETGALPSGLQNGAHSAFGGVGVPAKTAKPDTDKDNSEGGDTDATSATTKPQPSPSGGATTAKDADDQAKKDQDKKDADGVAFLGRDAFALCRAAANGDKDDRGVDLATDQLQKLAKAAGIPADQAATLKSKLDAQRGEFQKMMDQFCERVAAAEKDLKDGKTPPFPVPTGDWPTAWPTNFPTDFPTDFPSVPWPTSLPSGIPSKLPTNWPSGIPTKLPTNLPTGLPTNLPTGGWPTKLPTALPSGVVPGSAK